MNLEGVVLKLLLVEHSSEQTLEQLGRLKGKYFREPYATIYRLVENYYQTKNSIPSMQELLALHTRTPKVTDQLMALSLIEVVDLPLETAIDALIDQFSQNIVLTLFTDVVDKIDLMDREEILEIVGKLPLRLEEEVGHTSSLVRTDQLRIFHSPEDLVHKYVPTGISNSFDSKWGGFFPEDLVLIGGYRGTGKSIFCANLAAAQYLAGNVAVYFTIEMTAAETFMRIMSILSQVPYDHIKKSTLTPEEVMKLARVRAGMFEGGDALLDSTIQSSGTINPIEFETELVNKLKLKQDNQIVIVDDRRLSIAAVDTTIGSLKARHGNKLRLGIVDYVNQLVIDKGGSEMFDWTVQTLLAKYLKEIARKHGIPIASPYQIDNSGEARFAKGLLDACDLAIILKKESNGDLTLDLAKARSGDDKWSCRQNMLWECVTIDPREVTNPPPDEPVEEKKPRASRKKAASNPEYQELEQ